MDRNLRTWLSQYVNFDFVNYKPDFTGLVVDMFISDNCNLRCKHCYFGNTITIGTPLSTQDWKNIIRSLFAEGVRHFHISGRESSLDNRILEIVSFIKSFDGTYSGLVSNGTGRLQFYKDLIKEGIDYLEFSIDGTEDTHNYIRGKTIFSQIISLLESLSQHSKIIDITTCLNKNSYDEYLTLIDICLPFGIRKFFATPYVAKGNGKSFDFFSISPTVFSQLLKKSFMYLELKSDQKIALKYCIPHEMTYPLIEKGDYFKQLLVNYLSDNTDMTYSVNGNLIQIALNLLDIQFLHNLTLTSDGEVIPCSDYISDNNYTRFSIGNIAKTDIATIIKAREQTIINNFNSLKNETKTKQNCH